MTEESLKDELRAALASRPQRQPRNLLAEPKTEKRETREGKPGLLARLRRSRQT